MELSEYPSQFARDPDGRRKQAIRAVESVLYRRAASLPAGLRPNHPARLIGWQLPLHSEDGVLVRYRPEALAQLDPLARHDEVARAEAEALLVHEQLGYVLLSDAVRDENQLRALGIPPADEAARFDEIAACHLLSPKHILVDTPHFVASVRLIEGRYGLATALAYALLLIVGVRNREEMVKYGGMVQSLFDRLTLAPTVARTLNLIQNQGLGALAFDHQFAVLSQVREHMWRVLPRKPGLEFRLNRVLEAARRPNATVTAGNLGLAALDAVLLAKLGFPLRLVNVDGALALEVILGTRSSCWEVIGTGALSSIPLRGSRKTDVFDLLPLSYYQIGVWNRSQGQMTRAIASFRQTIALKPDMAEAYNELGHTYLRSNKPDEAIAACERAVSQAPAYAEAYVTLGSALLTRGRVAEAIDALKQAIRIKPNLAEAFNNLGFAYEQNREPDKAVLAFRTAIRLRPDYAHAFYNLGNSYLTQGKQEAAIEAYQQTVRINPGFVRAYYNLGQAFYQRQMLEAASDAYRRVLRINPKHAGALYNLGIIYRDQGLTEKAVETLEKAVELNPNLLR
jgi:tetratricopeptide (TPR) repeat protein